MAAYYNEIEPYPAQWLRNLIAAGLIAPGDVDKRDIKEVRANDLRGYVQCHFFAGIGGWSYAARLAGWPDDRPVWTGSCPCQPFSAAGRRAGLADDRHLWPVWYRLIRECRPDTIFGEQVASPDALGWLDNVQAGLEAEGYAVGAVDTCAAGVGAPHVRQRLYWVADLHGDGCAQGWGAVGPAGHDRVGGDGADGRPGPTNGHWRAADWLHCRDGRWRPVEPGTRPLAHGVSARVGRLRAYGNAIVPQQAAAVISAFMECRP